MTNLIKSKYSMLAVLFIDISIINISLIFAFYIRFTIIAGESLKNASSSLLKNSELINIGSILLLFLFASNGLYNSTIRFNKRQNIAKCIKSLTQWLFIFLAITYALRISPEISRLFLIISLLVLFFAFYFFNQNLLHCFSKIPSKSKYNKNLLIAKDIRIFDESFIYLLSSQSECVFSGYIADSENKDLSKRIKFLGQVSNYKDLFVKYPNSNIYLNDIGMTENEVTKMHLEAYKNYSQIKTAFNLNTIFSSKLVCSKVCGKTFVGLEELPIELIHNRIIKRIFDIVFSLIGLILSVPVILIFGTIVYIESPGPIFYTQTRTGRMGRQFKLIKIRSMRVDAEKNSGAVWATANDTRKLRIGNIMRRFNIDEVPQFWNVLRGEMSMVGPRPERPELIQKFKNEIEFYNARHMVKPGLTGWAQVNGFRGNTSLKKRIQHDIAYLDNWNLWFDLQIIIQTIFVYKNAY